MRRVVVTEFVSLDGVMEAPGGEPDFVHSGWVFPERPEMPLRLVDSKAFDTGVVVHHYEPERP